MQKHALIVAGGSGTRMQSDIPKQFIELAGKPILIRTLEAFNFDDIQIILVLPASQVDYWNELCAKHQCNITHQIVHGGETRFQSVNNGLNAVQVDGLVAIHDGVRPMITRHTISESFEVATEKGNAIVAVKPKDSIREVTKVGNQAINRETLRLIQTPQTFQIDLIKQAYKTKESNLFTDDASVLEASGQPIHLIDGSYTNIKITTPEDLAVAQSFLDR